MPGFFFLPPVLGFFSGVNRSGCLRDFLRRRTFKMLRLLGIQRPPSFSSSVSTSAVISTPFLHFELAVEGIVQKFRIQDVITVLAKMGLKPPDPIRVKEHSGYQDQILCCD
jgi:hypothetical protein